jgi:hypothetical protein
MNQLIKQASMYAIQKIAFENMKTKNYYTKTGVLVPSACALLE